MARSTLQVLEILRLCVDVGINVHVAKQKMILDGSMQVRITATVVSLAAEIEREFIPMRTRDALAKRKAEGVQFGRPKGLAERVMLEDKAGQIMDYLAKKISKRDIAMLLKCSTSALNALLRRRGVKYSKEKR